MEPMNRFLTAATPEFKAFIEEICSWNPSHGVHHEPQYQAATQVKQRLPLLSREGLPSLPFLLDPPKSLATLVDLWTEHAPSNIVETGVDDSVKAFHEICTNLKQRVKDCMADAEMAQEPNSKLERQWQKMLNEQPKSRISHGHFREIYGETDITALPQPPEVRNYSSRYGIVAQRETPRAATGEEAGAEQPYDLAARTMTGSTNSSSASFEAYEDSRNRPSTSGKDGSSKGRFFDRSRRKKGRIEQSPTAETNFI